MSCPCPVCTGREFFQDIHFTGGRYRYEPQEVEVEEPTSIYDRLAKVADELQKYGAPAHFINDLNQLCEDIDSIDTKVTKLEKYDRGGGELTFEVNEISKELM